MFWATKSVTDFHQVVGGRLLILQLKALSTCFCLPNQRTYPGYLLKRYATMYYVLCTLYTLYSVLCTVPYNTVPYTMYYAIYYVLCYMYYAIERYVPCTTYYVRNMHVLCTLYHLLCTL